MTLLILVFLTAGLGLSQATGEIEKAEKEWVAAITRADLKGLERILADELVYTHGSGLVESKSQYIQALRSGHQKYASVQHGSLKTRTYGNTAVVTGEVRMTGSTKGEPFDSRLRMTHVWVKQGPHWRLVAHQTTRLP